MNFKHSWTRRLKYVFPIMMMLGTLFGLKTTNASWCSCTFKLRSILRNTGILFDLLALCVSPCESNIQIDCSHIFHRVISMKGENTNANCNRK